MIGLIILATLLIQLPVVQNYVVDQVAKSLSKSLDTQVRIDEVKIKFFKRLALSGLYIEDHEKDSLFYANEMVADINYFKWWQRKLSLGNIELSGLKLMAHRHQGEREFNYQFLIDYFQSSDTTAKPISWELTLDQIKVTNSILHFDDAEMGRYNLFDIGRFAVYPEYIDLPRKEFHFRQIALSESMVRSRQANVGELSSDLQQDAEVAGALTFPELGLSLRIDQLLLENNQLVYENEYYSRKQGVLDYNHINMVDLSLLMKEVVLKNDIWAGEIYGATVEDHGGFVLDELSANIDIIPSHITLDEFSLKTPTSEIRNSTSLSFGTFHNLSHWADSVHLISNFDGGYISMKDLRYVIPDFEKLPYLNTDQDVTFHIGGNLVGTLSDLDLQDFLIKSDPVLHLEASGHVSRLLSTDPQFDIDLMELSTSYEALHKMTKGLNLPVAIRPWGTFLLKGNIRGSIGDLLGENVVLETDQITGFEADFNIQGLPNLDRSDFDLDIRALRSVASDLTGFFPDGIPYMLDSLGVFYYQGDFKGTIYDFRADGQLISDAGTVETDIQLNFSEDYKNAEFNGDVAMDSFNLGRVLGVQEVGKLTLNVNIFGHGLSVDNLRATVLGEIESVEFNGYPYTALSIDGRFDQQKFVGNAQMVDPNLSFRYEGLVDFADAGARFKFDATLDTINFTALNLMDNALGLSAVVSSDFRGNTFQNMRGEIQVNDLQMNNLNSVERVDSLRILSDNTQAGARQLEIHSDVITGELTGDFNPTGLVRELAKYLDRFFPIQEELDLSSVTDSIVQQSDTTLSLGQNFTYDITIGGATPFLSVAMPQLTKLDTVKLSGHFNTRDQNSSIYAYVAGIEYDGMSFGPINLTSTGEDDVLDNMVTIEDIALNDNLKIPFMYADATLLNDTAYLSTVIQDRISGGERLSFASMITKDSGDYIAQLSRYFVLNDATWDVDPSNKMVFGGGGLEVVGLRISKDSQQFALSSLPAKRQDEGSPLQIEFDNFDLDELVKLFSLDEELFQGTVNGSVTLQNLTQEIRYLADLRLEELTIKDENIGDLIIQSQQQSATKLDLLMRLEGAQPGLDIRGQYDLSNGSLALKGEVDRLALHTIDPFMTGLIHDSEGRFSGQLDIRGTIDQPQINGSIDLEGISTVIDYLQARYRVADENIVIENNRIRFDDVQLEDELGNEAKIDGQMTYENAGMAFDLDVRTDKFQILNTAAADNELFYGTLFVDADLQLSGSSERPVVLVNATTVGNSRFHVQPLAYEESLAQQSFIIYGNPEDFQGDTSISIQELYKLNQYGIDLTANLNITPDVQLEIIIDPVKGDRLVCRGNAELSVEMDPSGDLDVLGSYSITQGEYDFNFQNVIKRKFAIEPGSRVDFIGDPLRSKFDIQAAYNVKTTTYELIRNQSTLNQLEENRSRQRSDVQVILNLSGNLERPVANFDIEIQEDRSNALASAVGSKLTQLRENESEMNKQVFGLLILNSFIAEEQSTGAELISDAGQSALLTSVSSLVSNQLNRLAKKYIKGVDLDFGLDSYSNRYGPSDQVVTELEVGMSKRLLNDRLTLKLGGNFLFDNENNVDVLSQQNATFSGDFVLEYKLSPSGNYNLKFFQILSNEENLLSPGANYSETGVSILFTKSFNSSRYQLQLEDVGEINGGSAINNE